MDQEKLSRLLGESLDADVAAQRVEARFTGLAEHPITAAIKEAVLTFLTTEEDGHADR